MKRQTLKFVFPFCVQLLLWALLAVIFVIARSSALASTSDSLFIDAADSSQPVFVENYTHFAVLADGNNINETRCNRRTTRNTDDNDQ